VAITFALLLGRRDHRFVGFDRGFEILVGFFLETIRVEAFA